MKSFNVIHHDGVIHVRVDDNGHAILDVQNIKDREILVMAVDRALQNGATTGTLFTGEVVNDQLAGMYLMRAENATTWLGGKVTRLADGEDGPQFRIDWDSFPQITE